MKNYFSPFALLSPSVAIFCISLFYSCTSDVEPSPPPSSSSSLASSPTSSSAEIVGNSSSNAGTQPSSSSSLATSPTSSSAEIVGNSSSNADTLPSSSSETSSSSESQDDQIEDNVFIDPRDGKKYRLEVAPNGKIWMIENLNYSRDNTLGYCYGVDIDGDNPHRDSTSCDNGYGRNYDYATAIDGNPPQGLCPKGWHIPNNAEWNPMIIESRTPPREMSRDFYIHSGNYNINAMYPPIGWKEREESGFYWTSSGNDYFIGFWDGPLCRRSYYECIVEAETGASASDYFSIRCIQD